MAISREEQLKILDLIEDSKIDYTDASATDEEFWQNTTVNAPLVQIKDAIELVSNGLDRYNRQAH